MIWTIFFFWLLRVSLSLHYYYKMNKLLLLLLLVGCITMVIIPVVVEGKIFYFLRILGMPHFVRIGKGEWFMYRKIAREIKHNYYLLQIRLGFLLFSPVLENFILHLGGCKMVFVPWMTSWYSAVMNAVVNSYATIKIQVKRTPKEMPKQQNIANVLDSAWLSLFMDGSERCKLPSTPPSTGLSRIQHLNKVIVNFEFYNLD